MARRINTKQSADTVKKEAERLIKIIRSKHKRK